VAADWASAVAADAPNYWYRFEGSSAAAGVPNEGSVAGFGGIFGTGITDADLGKAGASVRVGSALEFTGPAVGNATTKYVDFGTVIPELVNLRTAMEDGKATTVEYWIKTTQAGSSGDQTWNSPSVMAREDPGDGDMYWGYITQAGRFGFSTSDLMETFATNVTDGNWHHVVMTKIWNTNAPCVSRLYVDGGALTGGQTYEVTTPAGAVSFQDADSPIRYLGFTQNGGGANSQFIGQIDELAIYSAAFREANARLHYLAAAVAAPGFSLTDASIDPGTGRITITWDSAAGVTYEVERTASLSTPEWSVIQSVPATGASSSFTDENPPVGAEALFYRVKR
jgi:hypothetical protein